jgi:hypothetical protein
VSYDLKLEKELLTYIRDWQLDADAPGGGAPLSFPETLAFIPSLRTASNSAAQHDWRRLVSHFEVCTARGWVAATQTTPTLQEAALTPEGHQRLDWYRDKEWRQRVPRLFEGAFQSIFLPVVASILTVLALNWLGLAAQ